MLGRGSLYNAGSHGGSSSSQSGISIAASSSHSQASAATLTRKRRKADELRQQMERASVVEIPLHDRIRDYDAAMEQMQMQISNGGAGSSSSGSASGAGGHRHRQEDLEREQLCGKWADSNDRRDMVKFLLQRSPELIHNKCEMVVHHAIDLLDRFVAVEKSWLPQMAFSCLFVARKLHDVSAFSAYGDSYEDLLEKLLSEQGRGRWSVEQCEAMEFRLVQALDFRLFRDPLISEFLAWIMRRTSPTSCPSSSVAACSAAPCSHQSHLEILAQENEERMQHQKARFLLECLFFAPHVTSSVPGAGAGGVIRHRPSVAVAIAFYCAKNKQQVDAILDIALQHRSIGSHVPAILKDIEEFLRGELYLKKVFKFVANSGKRVVAGGGAAQEPRAPSPFDAVGTRGQIEPGQKSQASQQSNGSPGAACSSSGDGVMSDLVYPEYRNFSASMFRDTLCVVTQPTLCPPPSRNPFRAELIIAGGAAAAAAAVSLTATTSSRSGAGTTSTTRAERTKPLNLRWNQFAEKWRELLETRRQVLGMSPQTSPVKVVKKADEINFSEGRQQHKMVRTPESEKKQSPPPKRKYVSTSKIATTCGAGVDESMMASCGASTSSSSPTPGKSCMRGSKSSSGQENTSSNRFQPPFRGRGVSVQCSQQLQHADSPLSRKLDFSLSAEQQEGDEVEVEGRGGAEPFNSKMGLHLQAPAPEAAAKITSRGTASSGRSISSSSSASSTTGDAVGSERERVFTQSKNPFSFNTDGVGGRVESHTGPSAHLVPTESRVSDVFLPAPGAPARRNYEGRGDRIARMTLNNCREDNSLVGRRQSLAASRRGPRMSAMLPLDRPGVDAAAASPENTANSRVRRDSFASSQSSKPISDVSPDPFYDEEREFVIKTFLDSVHK